MSTRRGHTLVLAVLAGWLAAACALPETIVVDARRADAGPGALDAAVRDAAAPGVDDAVSAPDGGACATGQTRCGEVCANTEASPAHCGGCGQACALPNATATCRRGSCAVQACAPGFADCNGDDDDGCEISLASTAHCGACGRACAPANAVPVCRAGVCSVASCMGSFRDCNGSADDGCETNVNTSSHCGGCGVRCAAGQVCTAGRCASSCGDGESYCTGACVRLVSDTSHCGSCDRACSARPNAAARCVVGACTLACNAGYGDCDRVPDNGCEAELATDARHCGACGRACIAGPHAVARCASGACRTACEAGFADCDHDPANGCEVDLATDARNCGSCGMRCRTKSDATAVCAAGVCGLACPSGFGDCNRDADDGCETSLATNVRHCGACGQSCPGGANAAASCRAGACALVCNAGYADCDGSAENGCEAALGSSPAHCGGCGRTCAAPAACVQGVCTAPTEPTSDAGADGD